jgi:hypothetical protein
LWVFGCILSIVPKILDFIQSQWDDFLTIFYHGQNKTTVLSQFEMKMNGGKVWKLEDISNGLLFQLLKDQPDINETECRSVELM